MEVITTHLNAEFDSFASMVAARRLYPEALMVFPGAQEKSLRLFLDSYPHQYRFRRMRGIKLDRIDRLIIVDTRRADRIGRFADIIGKKDLDIHIYDHHPPASGDIRGSHEVIVETGANITIFVELLRKKQMRITPAEATYFGLGIYEDTGSLLFTSTTPRDIRAAAYLLECGLDLKIVSDYVTRELTPEQVSLLNDLLKSREFFDFGGMRMAVATAVRDRFVGDLAMLGHKMKDIENLNVLFLLVRMHDRIHLVARSRLKAVDAGDIAAALGGGGHPTAAAAVIHESDLEKVKKRLTEAIKEKVKPVYLARNIMSSTLKSITDEAAIVEAKEIMGRFGIDHLPVLHDGRLIGIINREAVERAVRHGLGDSPATDFMTTDYEPLSPDDSFYRIKDLFLNHGQQFLPVLEKKMLVGAVTRSDLLGILKEEAYLEPAYRYGPPEKRTFRATRNVARMIEERLPAGIVKLIGILAEVSWKMNVNAYLVGGFVRDLLLNVPNLDVDVVVEGSGITYAREVVRKTGGRVRSHKKFETAVIIMKDGFKIDVATARMEYYEQPGALPKIEHGSIKMDLYRRDFSINALAIQLSGEDFGRLIDFFGGQKDMEEGIIRVLHDLSFVDDPTRIFRGVRIEQRLNFAMGEHTLKLMANAVRGHLVEAVAGPRVLGELEGILREKKPLSAILRLRELDLLKTIHPAMGRLPLDVELIENLIKAVDACRDKIGDGLQEWVIYLAALARQFTLEELNFLIERLGMSPGLASLLMDIYIGHRRLAAVLNDPSLKLSLIYRAADYYSSEVALFTLGCYPGTAIADNIEKFLESRGRISPLLNGVDLKKMGYEPGPSYKKMLNSLFDAQLDGEVTDRRGAKAWLKKAFGSAH